MIHLGGGGGALARLGAGTFQVQKGRNERITKKKEALFNQLTLCTQIPAGLLFQSPPQFPLHSRGTPPPCDGMDQLLYA